jgi:predicted neuraminidase
MKLQEFVFESGASFESCHASTLVVLPDGGILAAWFAGTLEGADDVAIWMSLRKEGHWKAPVKVADEEGQPHWNPVLFQDGSGKVWLFYKVGKKIDSWRTMYLVSDDNGRTWSSPDILVQGDSGGRGPVKNKPIVLHDGTWAAPASYELHAWEAFVDLSPDEGKTWAVSEFIALRSPEHPVRGKGVIQPALWESEPGKVHMLLRSSAGSIYRSDSGDGGKTWTDAYTTGLPNNNSGIDLVRMDNGDLVLVYNPIGENWGQRTPIVISLSRDNGATWGETLVLEDEPGEYSYPAIVSVGREVFVTYTWRREKIAFRKLLVTGSNDSGAPSVDQQSRSDSDDS